MPKRLLSGTVVSSYSNKTIVVNRDQRSENFFYKLMYKMHKMITFIFTGKLIKFGNFVCLPKEHINDLVSKGFLWNCFSATIEKNNTCESCVFC